MDEGGDGSCRVVEVEGSFEGEAGAGPVDVEGIVGVGDVAVIAYTRIAELSCVDSEVEGEGSSVGSCRHRVGVPHEVELGEHDRTAHFSEVYTVFGVVPVSEVGCPRNSNTNNVEPVVSYVIDPCLRNHPVQERCYSHLGVNGEGKLRGGPHEEQGWGVGRATDGSCHRPDIYKSIAFCYNYCPEHHVYDCGVCVGYFQDDGGVGGGD